jgi:hypothetical protein
MNLELLQQKGMTIELLITRKCNMYCSHCFYDCGPKESAKYMDAEMLTKVKKQIQFLRDLDIVPVINIVGGEPTVNLNEFKKVFDEIFSWNIDLTMSTNGWWLSSKEATKRFFDIISKAISPSGEAWNYQSHKYFILRVSDDPYHFVGRKITDLTAEVTQAFYDNDIPVPDKNSPWLQIPQLTGGWVPVPNGRGSKLKTSLEKSRKTNFCFHERYLTKGIANIHYEPAGNITDACGYGSIYDFGDVEDNVLYINEIINQYQMHRDKSKEVHNCFNCRSMVQLWKKSNLEKMREKYKLMNTFDVAEFSNACNQTK